MPGTHRGPLTDPCVFPLWKPLAPICWAIIDLTLKKQNRFAQHFPLLIQINSIIDWSLLYCFVLHTQMSKKRIHSSWHTTCYVLFQLPGGFHTQQQPHSVGAAQYYQTTTSGSLGKLTALHMSTCAAVVEGREECFKFTSSNSDTPRWSGRRRVGEGWGSQTGNLAVTNPPHKPSGHSCLPCWLVISSWGKTGCFKT